MPTLSPTLNIHIAGELPQYFIPTRHPKMADVSPNQTPCDQGTGIGPRLSRAAQTSCLMLVFVLSLLSFPSVTPWMIAWWTGWSVLQIVRGKPGWLPIVACLATLLIRPVAMTPAMVVLLLAFALAAALLFRCPPQSRHSLRRLVIAVMILNWAAMYWEWQTIQQCSQPAEFDVTRPVVCLGDSLTEGLRPDRGYPDALKQLIAPEVINLGFSGIATRQGLDQIDRVLKHHPQVVIIELGGHDFLKGHSRRETRDNLRSMIRSCREHGSDVILMEIPRGFIFDPFRSIERQVAYEEDVQLISDTWLRQIVLQSPIAPPGKWMSKETHLSSDGIHSNKRGSQKIAARVAATLQKMYGKQLAR
ncbi:GDSL-type esterase/lipase family protein [Planctomycetes bacterium K23_9]|uniref:Acyl-CoA thioesterase I n=1 Tax=Stieleria marina TaxID=1930275 RepID=A0A517NRD6_9BACT|nr:Acyl-CoA thioesterase I precursor [Planctomycetes bacterium K23_9]